ncbi:MAG: hypothetical protein HWN80_19255 [Candidatus Lokiarchaeota archaeon]|nr:hypothetical protein [Candidatus Lokiarchaeota archaeon]
MTSRKKSFIALSICILLVLIVVGAGIYYSNEPIHTTGTVKYMDFEGGFYGIIADDGSHYDPMNLPEGFKTDGLRVIFSAIIKRDLFSFHMWGLVIEIIDIQLL